MNDGQQAEPAADWSRSGRHRTDRGVSSRHVPDAHKGRKVRCSNREVVLEALRRGQDHGNELVPKSGQAKTQQGEMLRAVEKLRDSWYREGNAYWDDAYEHFVDYLREHLTSEDSFTDKQKRQINEDLDIVADHEHGDHSDDLFDRLADRVVEWTHAHPEPIPHEELPDLER